MAALTESQLVAAFRQAYDGLYFADFEAVEAGGDETSLALPILLGSAEKARFFEVFGQTGQGSLLAFWQEPGRPADRRPVVWLDSEGAPRGVFADDFAGFLALLPYGTDLLGTILYHCDGEHRQGEQLSVAELTAEVVPACLAQQDEEEGRAAYVAWLTSTAGLTVADQPVAAIVQAYRTHANVEDWRAG